MSKSDSSVDEKSIRSVEGAEAAVAGYTIDPEAEKKLLRKLDWRLLPLATAISDEIRLGDRNMMLILL